jgi:hypothetical protein
MQIVKIQVNVTQYSVTHCNKSVICSGTAVVPITCRSIMRTAITNLGFDVTKAFPDDICCCCCCCCLFILYLL